MPESSHYAASKREFALPQVQHLITNLQGAAIALPLAVVCADYGWRQMS
jgi:hypothetical protein